MEPLKTTWCNRETTWCMVWPTRKNTLNWARGSETPPGHNQDTAKTPPKRHRETIKRAQRHTRRRHTRRRHTPRLLRRLPILIAIKTPRHHRHHRTPQTHHQDTTHQGTTNTIETPRRHHRETTKAPPKRNRDTSKTPARGTTETPSRHHRDTTETAPRHHWNRDTAQAGSREPDGARSPLELTTPSHRYWGTTKNSPMQALCGDPSAICEAESQSSNPHTAWFHPM